MKSAVRMATYDFGYDARGLTQADISPPPPGLLQRYFLPVQSGHGGGQHQDAAQLRNSGAHLRHSGRAERVSKMSGCNLRTGAITSDRTIESGAASFIPEHCNVVGAGFFHTIVGIPMAEGRDFLQGDDATGVIILGARTCAPGCIRTSGRSGG